MFRWTRNLYDKLLFNDMQAVIRTGLTRVVGPEDRELLEVLSAQLGVVLGNVALWQELSATRERLEHAATPS